MNRFPYFGVSLIIFGGLLFLSELDLINVNLSLIFWSMLLVLGAVLFIRGFVQSKGGEVFTGTSCFLSGLFFVLRHFNFVHMHYGIFSPVTFLIIGLSFLMLAIVERNLWTLFPALILSGIGMINILDEYGYVESWLAWQYVRKYWPVLIILAGIATIVQSSSRRRRVH